MSGHGLDDIASAGPQGPDPAPSELVALADLVALAGRIQAVCLARGITVATAESCTGGLVAHLLTEVAGSSGYVRGGVVSYADDVKADLLDVPGDMLAAHGAVSAQVARAMALGARARLRSDVAVAITGIAGPGGGSDAKPVGLTYIGIADAQGTDVRRHLWSGDRSANKRASARAALALLLERVDGGDSEPPPGLQGDPAGAAESGNGGSGQDAPSTPGAPSRAQGPDASSARRPASSPADR